MIGLSGWRVLFGGGIFVYLLLIATVAVGLNHGLHADTAGDAQIDYENVEVSGDDGYQYDNPLLPEELERDEASRNERVEQFAKMMTRHALWVSNEVSEWAYQNQSWISPWWAGKLLEAATYGGLLVYAVVVFRRFRELSGEVFT